MADPHPIDPSELYRGYIEPRAVDLRLDHDGQIRLSIAISLKRIADVAEAWAQGAFNYPHKPNPLCEHGLLPLDCSECVPLP